MYLYFKLYKANLKKYRIKQNIIFVIQDGVEEDSTESNATRLFNHWSRQFQPARRIKETQPTGGHGGKPAGRRISLLPVMDGGACSP